MRKNIVSMLDHIGLAKAFRVPTCARLFDDDSEQVHFASAPRYPVFVGTANYDGGPNIFNTPLLKRMVETFLGQEVAALPNALWLPLGRKPEAALNYLASHGLLSGDHILTGMPIPVVPTWSGSATFSATS